MFTVYICLAALLSAGQSLSDQDVSFLPMHSLVEKTDKAPEADNWEADCVKLNEDVDQAWNLAGKVLNTNADHIVEIASAVYDFINCEPTVIKPLTCLFNALTRIRTAVGPAIKDARECSAELFELIPNIVRDTKKCIAF